MSDIVRIHMHNYSGITNCMAPRPCSLRQLSIHSVSPFGIMNLPMSFRVFGYVAGSGGISNPCSSRLKIAAIGGISMGSCGLVIKSLA